MRKWLVEYDGLGGRAVQVCNSYGEASVIAAEKYPQCCPITEYITAESFSFVEKERDRYRTQVAMLTADPRTKELLRQYAELEPRAKELIDQLTESLLNIQKEVGGKK